MPWLPGTGATMVQAYSSDLRSRVIKAATGGLSARQAAERFGVGVLTAIVWVRRYRESGEAVARRQGKPRGSRLDAHGALQLGMTEQELAGPQVARPFVDESHLGPAQAVSAVAGRVKARQNDPVVDESPVLPRRDVVAGVAPTWEKPVAGPRATLLQPSLESVTGRLGHLERYRSAGLLLNDGRPEAHAFAEVDVGHAQLDEIAATKLAVDRDVEHGEVADVPVMLEAGPDGPDVSGLEGRLRADDAAAVPGHAGRRLRRCYSGHGELL